MSYRLISKILLIAPVALVLTVREQDAKENMWTSDGGSGEGLEKTE